MEFTPNPTEHRRLIIDRVPTNPNPVRGLHVQTAQERLNEVRQMITIWRGRQIQRQQQGAGG